MKRQRWHIETPARSGVPEYYGCLFVGIGERPVFCGPVVGDGPTEIWSVPYAGKESEFICKMSSAQRDYMRETGTISAGGRLYDNLGWALEENRKRSEAPTKSCDSCKKVFDADTLSTSDRRNDFWRCPSCTRKLFDMLDEMDRKDGR